MYLIQLLLPLYDNEKKSFPSQHFDEIRLQLAERFGGVTAFIRSPAVGLWKEGDIEVSRDDVVMLEVMTAELDERWWTNYRKQLEQKFRQDDLVIRALDARKL